MHQLSEVYESARTNIPLRLFPTRREVPAWGDLDDRVRAELEQVHARIRSVVDSDARLLANHQRVLGDFNRGLREGMLSATDDDGDAPKAVAPGPFQWGVSLGRKSGVGREADRDLVKHFLAATHLLAYEFGQLDFAFRQPYAFLLRNLSPERADELGELVFALRVLFHYEQTLVKEIVERPSFAFAEFHSLTTPAPSHVQHLSRGIVALFDQAPSSWQRSAANLWLAVTPFADGTSLRDEDFQAPEEAALAVLAKPIASSTFVQRQLARIALARSWVGAFGPDLDLVPDESDPATLWSVYQTIPGSRIRGGEQRLGDLVASDVIRGVSEYFEAMMDPTQSRQEHYRRHFPAFVRGFDARCEVVVDRRAFDSVAVGRSLSDGLRRFRGGGSVIGGVAEHLSELNDVLNALYHAHADPLAFVAQELGRHDETPLAPLLAALFGTRPALAKELFKDEMRFELSSRTTIQTHAPFDLLRGALYFVLCAVRPDLEDPGQRDGLLAKARERLTTLVRLPDSPQAREAARAPDIVEAAQVMAGEFPTLVRLMASLIRPLHLARRLTWHPSRAATDHLDPHGQHGHSRA